MNVGTKGATPHGVGRNGLRSPAGQPEWTGRWCRDKLEAYPTGETSGKLFPRGRQAGGLSQRNDKLEACPTGGSWRLVLCAHAVRGGPRASNAQTGDREQRGRARSARSASRFPGSGKATAATGDFACANSRQRGQLCSCGEHDTLVVLSDVSTAALPQPHFSRATGTRHPAPEALQSGRVRTACSKPGTPCNPAPTSDNAVKPAAANQTIVLRRTETILSVLGQAKYYAKPFLAL